MILHLQVVARTRSVGLVGCSVCLTSCINSNFCRPATRQIAATRELRWSSSAQRDAIFGKQLCAKDLLFGRTLRRRLAVSAKSKQKSKSSSSEIEDMRVSATCMCPRCQIMRPLLERYDQIKNREETIPQVTVNHVELNFARSGGAGGQNVNKVNTKVDMRFNVMEAAWLPERVRLKLMENEKNRINKVGEIVVSSSRTRKQKDNLEDALEKLQQMIDAAYAAAPSEKERIVTLLKKLDRGRAAK